MQEDYVKDVEKRFNEHLVKYGVMQGKNSKSLDATRQQNLEKAK